MAIYRVIYRVKPINYDISLFDLELGGGFSYQGTVKIDVDIKEATENIVLNSHQLKVHSAEILVGPKSGMSSDHRAWLRG